MDNLTVSQQAVCNTSHARGNIDSLPAKGRFQVEHWRGGRKIGVYDVPNAITNEGKNKLFAVMFNGATAIGTWYILLVDGSGSPLLAATDTYAQIGNGNGWNENTAYTEAARQQWTVGAAAGQQVTNSSPVVFTINASGSVYGMALVGGGTTPSAKGDHAGGGALWAEAAFASGTVTVANGDQLKVTYTVSC